MMIFILFLSVAYSMQTCTKNSIIAFALTHIDTNQNGRITAEELDHFIMESPCAAIPSVTGRGIVSFCDFNGDGELTAAEDIDPPNAPCLYSTPLMNLVCKQCDDCEKMM